MFKKSLKIGLALILGGVFLWLAFKNVDLNELWDYTKNISYGWILPLAITSLLSHFLRAERWRLLIEHDKKDLSRITIVSGVLVGYLLNLVGPRLGEVSRPVYVAKREGLSSSKLMGTIVLERAIDLATMMSLMVIVSIYLISDISLLEQILGQKTVVFLTEGYTVTTILWVILFTAVLAGSAYAAIKIIRALGRHFTNLQIWIDRAEEALKMFKDGLLSVREVRQWGLFLTYTILMWTAYILMTYIPFWMFDMQEVYDLGFLDALVLTVISALGIVIPSPGGIGTYHYFVKKTLLVLFAVPAVTGLAYATITHAAMIVFVCCFTPIFLALDKFQAAKEGDPVL